jgi:hypothetical protein
MLLRPFVPLFALTVLTACGMAGSPGAPVARSSAARHEAACPADLATPDWRLVETPVVRFCVPSGWATVKASSPKALVRVQGAKGWVEWRVGPFLHGFPPPRPDLEMGRTGRAPPSARPEETWITSNDRMSLGWTYWPPTDDAPGVVLLSQFPDDTLHEALLRSVRLEGAHRLAPRGYFPGGVLSPGDTSGASGGDEWYSRFLRAMGELRLAEGAAGSTDQIFRLTVLPSFTTPLAVRLHRRGSSAVVVTTVLGGAGGYEPGGVVWHDSVEVTPGDAESYLQRAKVAEFWSMPVQANDLGFDGTTWMLEGVQGGRYHVVVRWSPEATGRHAEFLKLANELLRLGQVELPGS